MVRCAEQITKAAALAAESVAFFHRGLLKSQVEKLLHAGTSQKLKREMEELELGSVFRHLNITNFLSNQNRNVRS